MQAALIIFVKNPIPGKTKTRLAASVGHEKALKMYHQLTAYTREQVMGLGDTQLLLYYSDFIPEEDEWPADRFSKRLQSGADLGARMQHAFATAFEEGAQRVAIIGSDCPGINTQLLRTALDVLTHKDFVIGPALDGGYYLLGSNRLHPTLFSEMEWSTETVAKQTLEKATALGLSRAELIPLSDVDYLEDWEKYGWPIPE